MMVSAWFVVAILRDNGVYIAGIKNNTRATLCRGDVDAKSSKIYRHLYR